LSKSNQTKYLCRCDCGTTKEVLGFKMRRGESLSCGCLSKELSSIRESTHGLSKHRLYGIWKCMMHRCYNPHNHAYHNYGKRGIYVCERWHSVSNFVVDNDKLASPGLTIDRINNDGPYSPDNTHWVTRQKQTYNSRRNVLITYQGETMPIFQWAKKIGIKPRTLWKRLRILNWSVDKALLTP